MAMNVRVGCQANAWQREFKLQERLPEALRQMAAAGFQGAELPVWSIPSLDEPAAVRDLLAEHGLAFIAVHVGGNFYDTAIYKEKTLPVVRRAAACAAAAGAEGMVISAAAKQAPLHTVPFDASKGGAPAPAAQAAATGHARKSAEELRAQRDALAEVARVHRDLGLATYYHNHFTEFEHHAEELGSILEVAPGLLSLCFDIGNAARALPGTALPAAMARYWDRIGYLHFKDILGETLAEALGDGEIDFGPIGQLARERGFRGWASAEIEPARGMVANRTVLEDARLSAGFIRQTLGL